jgi:outer membrane protein assembly factor BamA
MLWGAPNLTAGEATYHYPADSAHARLDLERAQADGYLDAALLTRDTVIRIVRGGRFRLVGVYVNDSLVVGDADEWSTREGLDRIARRELTRLQSSGHYLARVTIERLDRRGQLVNAYLRAVPGPLVKVSRILIEGLDRTNPAMIRRALPKSENELLTDRLLVFLTNQAGSLDYVTLTGPVDVSLRPGYTEADLILRYQERQQLRFFGGGGYSPDDEAGLVWNADLALNNPFGSGRNMSIHSSRPDRRRTTLTVDYSQPVFWFGLDRIRFSVATRDYRDDFYEFGLTAAYTTRIAPGFDLSLVPSWRRVEPSGAEIGYSAYGIGLTVTRDRVVEPSNPRSGYLVSSDITYINRRYSRDSVTIEGSKSAFNETRAMLHGESYLPLAGALIVKAGVTYQGYETGQALPPIAELYLVGGPGSLRGYRTEQFVARQTVQVSLEPRYRFETGYLFVFYDAAYINRPVQVNQSVLTEELYRSAVGLGLGLVWPSQQVTLSFGWGKESAIDQPRLAVTFVSNL